MDTFSATCHSHWLTYLLLTKEEHGGYSPHFVVYPKINKTPLSQ